jgi:hypothetical protein
MRALWVAAIAASTAGSATVDASAAMVVRLSIAPATPLVGATLTLSLRTYAPVTDVSLPCGFRPQPWRVSYPFRVQALAPDGTAYRIPVRQDRENLYTGQLHVPHKPGRWTVRVLNFFTHTGAYDPCSGARIRFLVRNP